MVTYLVLELTGRRKRGKLYKSLRQMDLTNESMTNSDIGY